MFLPCISLNCFWIRYLRGSSIFPDWTLCESKNSSCVRYFNFVTVHNGAIWFWSRIWIVIDDSTMYVWNFRVILWNHWLMKSWMKILKLFRPVMPCRRWLLCRKQMLSIKFFINANEFSMCNENIHSTMKMHKGFWNSILISHLLYT